MTPLLVIWYSAGLYALVLVAVDLYRQASSGRASWRRLVWTTVLPVLLGSAVFVIWPLVAWALARSP